MAAVILETVTGTNGVIPPPDGYLAVREVCDRHGILLILDEVMAGFGRTGRWFACEHWDVVPDVITVAKGINSGYVPLGAMIARGEIVDRIRGTFFPGGLTYAGHPLACASAIASIEAFQEEGGRERGRRRRASARRYAASPTGIRRSATCAARLLLGRRAGQNGSRRRCSSRSTPRRGRRARRPPKAALEQGLYLMTHWNVIMVVPPLTVTREEVDAGIAILDDVLAIADEHVSEAAGAARGAAQCEELRDGSGRLLEGVP